MALLKNYVYNDYFEENVWEKQGSMRWQSTKMLMQEPNHMQLFFKVFKSGIFDLNIRIKIFKWLFQIYRMENSLKNESVNSLIMNPDIVWRGCLRMQDNWETNRYFPYCRGFCFKCGEKAFRRVSGMGSLRNNGRILLMMLYCYACSQDGFRHIEDDEPVEFPRCLKSRVMFYDEDDLTCLVQSIVLLK